MITESTSADRRLPGPSPHARPIQSDAVLYTGVWSPLEGKNFRLYLHLNTTHTRLWVKSSEQTGLEADVSRTQTGPKPGQLLWWVVKSNVPRNLCAFAFVYAPVGCLWCTRVCQTPSLSDVFLMMGLQHAQLRPSHLLSLSGARALLAVLIS